MKSFVCVSLLYALIVCVSSVEIQYPATNPCMLIKLADDSHIDLSNGSTSVSYTFANASIGDAAGSCEGDSLHNLNLNVGNGVMFLQFSKDSNGVTVTSILYTFTANKVFEGISDSSTIIADDDAATNDVKVPAGTSYLCESEDTISFSITGSIYTCSLTISGVQIQAFEVQNGEYSNATVCAADNTTTAPTTTPATSQPVTTESSNVTTVGPNATTTETNITTVAPANTTTEVTTEPTTTNNTNVTTPTTTHQTTTPTTPAPPTTTAPPEPEIKTYQLSDGKETCIVFKAALQLNITYDTKDNKNVPVIINVPNTTVVDTIQSSCTDGSNSTTSQRLVLKFFPSNWELSMLFAVESSSSGLAKAADDKYSLQNLSLTYSIDADLFPNANNTGTRYTIDTAMDAGTLEATGSYKCDKSTTLKLSDQASVMTKNLQYQAFGTNNSTDFNNDVTECPSDTETNSIVPIAVGAALAGLVIIVLIAYLIGRRRSRGGYEQV